MQNNQPVAHIFAGANASGKSTFIAHLMSVGIIDNPKLQQELEKAGAGYVAVLAKYGWKIVKDSDLEKSNVTKSLIKEKPKGKRR